MVKAGYCSYDGEHKATHKVLHNSWWVNACRFCAREARSHGSKVKPITRRPGK